MYNFLKKLHLSPYLAVALSFFFLILIGSLFLSLPLAHNDGKWPNYIDSLFMSFSAVCLTGLSVYNSLIETYSLFGLIIMAILIQLGGLGFITIFTFIITLFRKKINMLDRFVLKEALSASEYSGVIKLVRKMVFISLIFEALGTIPFLFSFVPQFGLIDGFGKAVFHAITSFNNSGFDVLGSNSLIAYRYSLTVTINTAVLTTIGGLGFLTISEILKFKRPKMWSSQTKIVLTMTGIILVVMSLSLYLANLGSNDPLNLYESLMIIAYNRTGGFAITEFEDMSQIGLVVMMLTMLIGASPLSTGGGIKVTTFFVVVLIVFAYIRGKKVHAFKRTYSHKSFIQATVVIFFAILVILISYVAIIEIEMNNQAFIATGWGSNAILFDVVSAFTTTGASFGVTPMLSPVSKLILSLLMFIGRVGPITLMATVSDAINREEKLHYRYIESDVIVG